jgi:hypothetical protein
MKHGRSIEIIGLFLLRNSVAEWVPVFHSPAQGLLWYYRVMNYTSPNKPVPESIAASLARSEAQIAAGQTVPLESVLDRLRSSIARMQADADEKLKPPLPKA